MRSLKITAGFMIAILQMFLFLNADFIYGAYAPTARNVILFELLLVIVLVVFSNYDVGLLFRGPEDVTNAIVVFLAASFALSVLPAVFLKMAQVEATVIVASVAWLGLHAITIAFNEEVAFRGILDAFFPMPIQSAMFAVFHVGVKGGNLLTLLVLFALGAMLTVIRRRFGLLASVSAHFVWNLKALGVLDTLMLGM